MWPMKSSETCHEACEIDVSGTESVAVARLFYPSFSQTGGPTRYR